ncbi:DUF5119 domain-containing protein [uncultured Bacteroides sp.]|jgi:hypothetical protein|uniref:DUF5119 domain-containing protein n=1 Tax=uncultured Bacteroides sp. TaxID=162156 RepID=UPI00261033F4|nr:DUF5119 domain-containing protein [uncultured Bacteroides sp.]
MKLRSHLIIRMLMAVAIFLPLSCEHRDLCYDHSHWTDLKVEFDWSMAPDATPRTMVVYLFPREGGMPRRYEITNVKNGAKIRVPSGEFDAVTFNGDTETLKEEGTTYANFVVTTANESLLAPMERNITNVPPPRPDGTENDPVKQTPDKMWTGSVENISIVPLETPQPLRFTPKEATATYTIILKNAKNANTGIGVSVALTAMAESYSPSADVAVGRDVTIPIGLSVIDDTTLKGEVTVFGHCPVMKSERRHILTVYTSKMKYYEYDVTDQLHETPDPHYITIIIEGIELPAPDGTGMTPSVPDWDDVVNNDLDML